MDHRRFEDLVEEALSGLPAQFAARLENVAIVVQDWAAPEQLAQVDLKDPRHLLGLYEGIPLTDRARGYAGALPDRITIFRLAIKHASRNDEEIKEQVRQTVMHELGHYFGLDEERLREI